MNPETEYDNALRSHLTTIKRTNNLRKNNLRLELNEIVKNLPVQEKRRLTTFVLNAFEEWEDDVWNNANAFGRIARLCLKQSLGDADADG